MVTRARKSSHCTLASSVCHAAGCPNNAPSSITAARIATPRCAKPSHTGRVPSHERPVANTKSNLCCNARSNSTVCGAIHAERVRPGTSMDSGRYSRCNSVKSRSKINGCSEFIFKRNHRKEHRRADYRKASDRKRVRRRNRSHNRQTNLANIPYAQLVARLMTSGKLRFERAIAV